MTTLKNTPSEETGTQRIEAEVLAQELLDFCKKNPSQRFWQALRNWSEHSYVLISEDKDGHKGLRDTFYFKDKNK